MKGRRGNLEPEADQQHRNPGKKEWWIERLICARGDQSNVGGAGLIGPGGGSTVNQSNAVKEKCRGERSENEVLQRGFIRTRVSTTKTSQHVGRDRENLQSEKDYDEVASRSHQHHATRREQEQRMKLSGGQILDVDPNRGDQERQNRHNEENNREAQTQFVEHNHSVKCARCRPSHPKPN